MDPAPAFDFSGVTDALASMGPAFIGSTGPIILGGIGVAAVLWGAPKLIGLFKRTAK